MRRVLLKTSAICTLAALFVVSGYMLAVLSFRQETWIDYRSGARRTTCTVYPFSLSTDHSRDAFWVLFGSAADENCEWESLESRRLIDLSRIWAGEVYSHTETQDFARAESQLVAYLLRQEIDAIEREKLSHAFYSALRNGGASAAIRYVDKLMQEQLHRQRGAGEAEQTK